MNRLNNCSKPLEPTPNHSMFWSEWFWLREGFTWKDLEPVPGVPDQYHHSDMFVYPFVAAAAIYVIRECFLTPLIFRPIARLNGLRYKAVKPPAEEPVLERLYAVNRARPPAALLGRAAAEVGWPRRRVERWLRQRAAQNQMSQEEKFCDFGYQFVYYTLSCANFAYHLWGTHWFWDLPKCYDSYPNDTMPLGVRVGMWTLMGFYLNQLILLFKQPKRTDFNVMLTHHIMTLAIFGMSYIAKAARIVCITGLLHEVVDIFLSLGKLFLYCGYHKVKDFLFVIFCTVWYVTRVFLYPYYLIGTSITAPAKLIPSEYVAITFTIILFFAHVVWSIELASHIVQRLRTSELKDNRSDEEDEDVSDKED